MQRNMLEVGVNDRGEVVVNHPHLDADEAGVGHIVFSPWQARHFAGCLLKQASLAEAAPWIEASALTLTTIDWQVVALALLDRAAQARNRANRFNNFHREAILADEIRAKVRDAVRL